MVSASGSAELGDSGRFALGLQPRRESLTVEDGTSSACVLPGDMLLRLFEVEAGPPSASQGSLRSPYLDLPWAFRPDFAWAGGEGVVARAALASLTLVLPRTHAMYTARSAGIYEIQVSDRSHEVKNENDWRKGTFPGRAYPLLSFGINGASAASLGTPQADPPQPWSDATHGGLCVRNAYGVHGGESERSERASRGQPTPLPRPSRISPQRTLPEAPSTIPRLRYN